MILIIVNDKAEKNLVHFNLGKEIEYYKMAK